MVWLEGSVALASPLGRFLSTIASLMVSLVYLAPVRTMSKIIAQKTTAKIPVTSYFTLTYSCAVWIAYGFSLLDMPLIIPNCLGVVLGVSYILIFYYFSSNENRNFVTKMIIFALLPALVLLIFLSFLKDTEKKKIYLGYLAIINRFLFLISPSLTILEVFRNKSVDSLPFDLSFVQFWNSVCWFLYGLFVMADTVMLVGSTAGIILSAFQLYCHFLYGNIFFSIRELFCLLPVAKKIVKSTSKVEPVEEKQIEIV